MKKYSLVLTALLVVALAVTACAGANKQINMASISAEEAYGVVSTMYQSGNLAYNDWITARKAYTAYRDSVVALDWQQQLVEAGEPIDLGPYNDTMNAAKMSFLELYLQIKARRTIQ